jgi:hypothetical protein
VCLASVADCSRPRLLGELLSGLPSDTDVVPPPRELRDEDARGGGRDARAEHAQADARVAREYHWAAADGRLDLVQLGSSRTIGWSDRRSTSRIASIVLRDCQREAARTALINAASCGIGLRAYHSWRPGGEFGVLMRLVAQLNCGTRTCAKCQAAMRRRACARMEIPARYLASLTVPPYMGDVRDSWEAAHSIVTQFVSLLRRESKYATREITGKRRCDRARKRNRRTLARSRVGRGGVRDYSWAKEPQSSGMPHLHILIDCDWLNYAWVRQMWAAYWGALDADCDFRLVTSPGGACRYLSEYVAKQNTPIDILAIIKSKRLWTSTKVRVVDARVKWYRDPTVSEDSARWQVNNRDEARADSGWSLISGRDNCYAKWEASCDRPVWFPDVVAKRSQASTSGDRLDNLTRSLESLRSELDTSIIFEESMREKLYGKVVDMKQARA